MKELSLLCSNVGKIKLGRGSKEPNGWVTVKIAGSFGVTAASEDVEVESSGLLSPKDMVGHRPEALRILHVTTCWDSRKEDQLV